MGRIAFTDRNWEEGSDNMPGLVGPCYFIPKSGVDLAACTIGDDGVSLIGNVGLSAGAKIIEIYATENASTSVDAAAGEIDGGYTSHTLTFFTPGSDKILESQKRALRNTPGVWFYKDTDFNLRVAGIWAAQNPAWTGEADAVNDRFIPSLDLPARISASNGTSGARGGDRRGTTFEIVSDAPHAPLFVDGDLPVNPGVAEVASLLITAPVSTAGDVTVTLNGVEASVAVELSDTTAQVATKIRATSFAGWTTGGTASTVTFTATTTGAMTDAVYSAGTTGAAGTMSTTVQGL